eukprot:3021991-Amphidinium_carterae.1
MPLNSLSLKERTHAKDISVNLAVGKRQAKVWREEIYAEGNRVSRLLPVGRVLDKLGLSINDNATKLMCSDGKQTCTLMEFATQHHMRYVSEKQFNLLREALWAQTLGTVKVFDKKFWLDAVKHGMQQHLKGLDAYPTCQIQSVCFGHDGEDDEAAIDSTVMFARLAPAMIEEVETLLSNEVVPRGQRWDNVPS